MRIILITISLFVFICISHSQSFKENKTFNITTDSYAGSLLVDVNNDGYDDILYSDKKEVILYMNKGTGQIGFDSIWLFKNTSKEKIFHLYDADQDGDMDILVGVSGNIILVENQSTTEKLSFVKSNKDFYYFANQSSNTPQILVRDINGDMLDDIVVAYGQTKILYQKPDYTFFSYEIPNSRYDNITKISAADMNKDGKLELIFARTDSIGKLGLYYFINLNNAYSTKKELHNGPVNDFIVSDLNQDSLPDIFTINHENEGQILMYINEDIDSNKFDLQTLPLGISGHYTSMATADLNGLNGLNMIVGFEESFGIVALQASGVAGVPSFEVNQLDGSKYATAKLFASDIDKDGDLDIIQILDDDGFIIYEQKDLSSTNDGQHVTAVTIYPNPTNNVIYIDADNPFDRILLFDSAGNMKKDQHTGSLLHTTLTVEGNTHGIFILQVQHTDGKISSLPVMITK